MRTADDRDQPKSLPHCGRGCQDGMIGVSSRLPARLLVGPLPGLLAGLLASRLPGDTVIPGTGDG